MIYRTLGKTGIKASVVAFGGIVVKGFEPKQASLVVSKAIDAGVNYFDVAPSYGDAQHVLGPTLKSHRKDVFLACKTNKRTAKEAEEELNESLKVLETDYFDVYQMHGIDDPDDLEQVFAPGGAMEAIVKAKKQGKINNIGFSCHRERSALYLMNQFDFDTVMHPINFLCMERNGKGQLLIKQAEKTNMGILALKTLALRPYHKDEKRVYNNTWYHPIVNDDELATLAMRYTYNTGNVIMISPGVESYLNLMIRIEKENPKMPELSSEELLIMMERTKDFSPLFTD
ncbi:MAG: aldo/keto reductase [Clostridia bacterium]|nr:aldo/keto reductase [Clostridia bacterium]MBN2883246.1 aldo/keto reductase [Clostridia bacterium]